LCGASKALHASELGGSCWMFLGEDHSIIMSPP
jgi:hypothetical protein